MRSLGGGRQRTGLRQIERTGDWIGWSPKTAKTHADNFRRYILPTLGDRDAMEVTGLELDGVLDLLEDQRTRVQLEGRVGELDDQSRSILAISPNARSRGRGDRSADRQAGELPSLLRVAEVARLVRISRSLAYELATAWLAMNGEAGLPTVRLGRSLRISRTAVERLLNVGAEE